MNVQEQTRLEWSELGFFYDRDDSLKEWLIIGSRAGIRRFSELLRAYTANPRHADPSEHEHFSPYMYLKVMTWPDAEISRDSVHGTLDQLHRLADLVDARVTPLQPGARTTIRDEFAADSEYALVIELRADGFDPASADAALNQAAD